MPPPPPLRGEGFSGLRRSLTLVKGILTGISGTQTRDFDLGSWLDYRRNARHWKGPSWFYGENEGKNAQACVQKWHAFCPLEACFQ
jgi:hypothetical protein